MITVTAIAAAAAIPIIMNITGETELSSDGAAVSGAIDVAGAAVDSGTEEVPGAAVVSFGSDVSRWSECVVEGAFVVSGAAVVSIAPAGSFISVKYPMQSVSFFALSAERAVQSRVEKEGEAKDAFVLKS